MRRVVSMVDEGGAVRSPCRSRVLETVLALRLLEVTDIAPDAAAAARAFLARHAGAAVEPERSLAAAVLSRCALSGDLLGGVVGRVPDFTGSRKRALVHALGAVVDEGAVAGFGGWDEAAFSLSGLHSWARVQVTAVKVILACAVGRPGAVTDEDVRRLQHTQQAARVWEGNVLIHLFVLHALARLPGSGPVVAAGVRKALMVQRPDGGWPFVTDTDTWCTVTAGVALAANRAPQEVVHRVAGHLERCQQPAGGWSYTDWACQTDVDDTSVAVQFLHQAGAVRYQAAIHRGLRSLRSVVGPDGGFPTYLAGGPSEACMTAAAVDALNLQPERDERLIADALRYLAAQQAADGSFPPDWSTSRLHTLFRALLAAGRYPAPHPPHLERLVAHGRRLLRETQNADGGFGQQPAHGSDPISTAYGLTALCATDDGDPAAAARAAAYLTTAVRDDGSVLSEPDSIGPRPFTFTVPALAETFTLLAFGHLTERLTTAPAYPQSPLPAPGGRR
ncbi:prenyltransferase/squalene oxidase repeat-containing protein [Streptomyces sp. NPDC096136]|uniref:prenyltransferase/squalene oxidase repeat-containing protein n=1 Tax=Streptomyces sp. NPDC096136 TaxID=3366076 RepID=UPI00380F29C4